MQQRIGPYQVVEKIAAGGQATIDRAWDSRTGPIAAVKDMHPHLSRDFTCLERFLWGVRIAGFLGPLIYVVVTGLVHSRNAILRLGAVVVTGAVLLRRINIAGGARVAGAEGEWKRGKAE